MHTFYLLLFDALTLLAELCSSETAPSQPLVSLLYKCSTSISNVPIHAYATLQPCILL